MGHRFDDITLEQLRATGGLKWSQYPDAIGSFVAEMDFGTAPPVLEAMHRSLDLGEHGYLTEALGVRLAESFSGFARSTYGWEVAPNGCARWPTWSPGSPPPSSSSPDPARR